jgi:hypothetical protein
MQRALLAAAFALLVAACGKVTQENFARIADGMPEQQVLEILGKPDETSGGQVLGIAGTASRWVGADHVITVRFVNGKVLAKSMEPRAAAAPAKR